MNVTIETIAAYCEAEAQIGIPGSEVRRIIIDHRDQEKHDALFVAFKGRRFDGHQFIPELISAGVHHFIVTDAKWAEEYRGQANFIVVPDARKALQLIAERHRKLFSLPVVAISGSNGKTIVKEWLSTLLEDRYDICRSPKSYNSQIGVPLSVLKLNQNHSLGIFEVGISQPGEMDALREIVQPTIGLFTNLGDAHEMNFESPHQKFDEKWKLFDHCDVVIGCADHSWTRFMSEAQRKKTLLWSLEGNGADIQMKLSHDNGSVLSLENVEVKLPFRDKASIENAAHCLALMHHLNVMEPSDLQRLSSLRPVAMRMELKEGVYGAQIIDDSYNSDLGSLKASLDYLSGQNETERWIILSDLSENKADRELYEEIGKMLRHSNVTKVIGIGAQIECFKEEFAPIEVDTFADTNAFWNSFDVKSVAGKTILVKGSRKFKLENLVKRLQARQHETVLEIDLHKMGQNLSYYKQRLSPKTKLMVMVKAFAYGSGSYEVAQFLQTQKVDYLTVAYADEGMHLRQKGISLPIMVMSPSKVAYETMLQNRLEPEIFSLAGLQSFLEVARSFSLFDQQFPIHLKVDTGMHRLGFGLEDFEEALQLIIANNTVAVASIFSHLSASDVAIQDGFTQQQVSVFQTFYERAVKVLGYAPDRHILNSTGALRFPEYEFEMVRIGIGLYGFSGSEHTRYLHALGTLKSYIVQIRNVPAGESVGYNREGVSESDRTIATVAIGYADGLDRRLSHGKWSFKWQGIDCPVVGSICMDMTMIDVSNTGASEGDEVIVFQSAEDVLNMSKELGTIPYEILTKIPERVRRVYLQE